MTSWTRLEVFIASRVASGIFSYVEFVDVLVSAMALKDVRVRSAYRKLHHH